MVKKVFLFLTLYFLVIPSVKVFANDEQKYFTVTAYYSPTQNQKYYLTGNYEDEIALNGGGVRGASGKEVFAGMLAAPKKYSFGTKIYLEGLGTGVVEDRGGAIVASGERGYTQDRIDVWMGFGDEGLRKALSWGKRKVAGKILEDEKIEVKLDISNLPEIKTNIKINVFSRNIGSDSSNEDIKLLQELLQREGLYNGEIDGVYNKEVTKIVTDFQLKNGIIKNKYSFGAGYWGNRTRYLFFKNLDEYRNEKKDKLEIAKKENNKNDIKVVSTTKIDVFDTYISPESESEKIKLLQGKLKDLGLFSGSIDGNYKGVKEVLLKYQLKKQIISDNKTLGAGFFGPKTRELLKADYKNYLDEKKKEKEKKEKLDKLAILSLKEADNIVKDFGNPKFGQTGKNVRNLQNALKTLGYFDGKDTAIYGDKTKQSILKYQIDKKLVLAEDNLGAGKFGDKTKEILKKDLAKLILEKKIKESNIVAFNYKK